MGRWRDPKRYQGAMVAIASVVAKLKLLEIYPNDRRAGSRLSRLPWQKPRKLKMQVRLHPHAVWSSLARTESHGFLAPCKLQWKRYKVKPRSLEIEQVRSFTSLQMVHAHTHTQTPRCREAFLEDALLDTDQSDQNANKAQIVLKRNEAKLCASHGEMPGISEDAARCWAKTFARIARCAAKWARPSWFRA